MNASDRIKKAHVAIMMHKEFCAYSGVLSCGKITVGTDLPMPMKTACTDGWNVWYHTEFVDSLNDPELRFVVLHEAQHKAYQHLSVWKALQQEDARLANVAADHFVNLSLMDTDKKSGFLEMPKVGIQPNDKYRGWNVKQIFDDLKKEKEKNPQSGDGEGMDGHDWENAAGAGGSPKDLEAQTSEIQRALRQGEILRKKRAGQGAGSSDGMFGDLLTPKVDWRKVLREFVMEFCRGRDESSWARPNRRFLAEDVYMPSMIGVTMQELVIGFDTSGSCFGTDEMTRFVTELTAIIETVCPSKVHVIYWDTAVSGHQIFEDGQFAVQNLKPRGGGGTDGSVLFDYLRAKNINPAAIVQLSDGYVGSWGDSTWPTLWALTTEGLSAPYGTTLYIGG